LKALGLLYEADKVSTIGFFNSTRIRSKRVLFQEKGLSGESKGKERARKIEGFPKCSLFRYR